MTPQGGYTQAGRENSGSAYTTLPTGRPDPAAPTLPLPSRNGGVAGLGSTGRGTDWEAVRRRRFATGAATISGTGRKAHAEVCRGCGEPIISGLDADRCAFTATCDPWPVDAIGELLAVLEQRSTYSLTWRGTRYELDPRTAIEIAATPADTIEVLTQHRCGTRIPARSLPRRPELRAARAGGQRVVETFAVDPPF